MYDSFSNQMARYQQVLDRVDDELSYLKNRPMKIINLIFRPQKVFWIYSPRDCRTESNLIQNLKGVNGPLTASKEAIRKASPFPGANRK